jgi:ribosomal-protein-alanine N-acetyltransferase
MFRGFRLETERLILRPFSMEDLHPLHSIVSRKAVVKYLPEGTLSLDEVGSTLSWLIRCYKENTPSRIIKFTVAVIDRGSSRLIGWVGLGPLQFDTSQIEIYYGLAEEYWGKGLATEAARSMLAFGFNTLGLERISAVVKPGNAASSRVIEKLGMKYLGTLQNLPPEHGDYEGDLHYSISRDDFDPVD